MGQHSARCSWTVGVISTSSIRMFSLRYMNWVVICTRDQKSLSHSLIVLKFVNSSNLKVVYTLCSAVARKSGFPMIRNSAHPFPQIHPGPTPVYALLHRSVITHTAPRAPRRFARCHPGAVFGWVGQKFGAPRISGLKLGTRRGNVHSPGRSLFSDTQSSLSTPYQHRSRDHHIASQARSAVRNTW